MKPWHGGIDHGPTVYDWRDISASRGLYEGSSPVECYDRIVTQMTELALEPVRLLRERSLLSAVTTRALCGGRRFDITIAKSWPAGPDNPSVYRWELTEVAADGTPAGDTERSATTAADPEGAYWAAVEALSRQVGAAPRH